MHTIQSTDTLDTVQSKLRARSIVLMRLGLDCRGYYALGSRIDTLHPHVARGRTATEAIQQLEAALACAVD
jgi:hypothetical protein